MTAEIIDFYPYWKRKQNEIKKAEGLKQKTRLRKKRRRKKEVFLPTETHLDLEKINKIIRGLKKPDE